MQIEARHKMKVFISSRCGGNYTIARKALETLLLATGLMDVYVFENELVVDSRDLLNAIDRASFIKNDGVSIIRLSAHPEKVVISTRSQEVGSSMEEIMAESFDGKGINISFSGRYVYEAIRVLNASTIKISFSGEMKPFIIKNKEDNTVVQLVLPVRTYQ